MNKGLLGIFLFMVLCGMNSQQPFCDSNIIVPDCPDSPLYMGHKTHHKLMCNGFEALKNNNSGIAIENFKNANEVDIFEFPNFQELPWLALAYIQDGQLKKAKEILDIYEITIKISAGIIICPDSSVSNPEFTNPKNPHSRREKAFNRMCGGIFEGYHGINTLKDIQWHAELYEFHQKVSNAFRLKTK